MEKPKPPKRIGFTGPFGCESRVSIASRYICASYSNQRTADSFDETQLCKLPDGAPPRQAPGSPLLDRLETSRLSQFLFDVKDNLDYSRFNEAMDGWNMWDTELAPDLHYMTTSLLPPDVDAAIKLHAECGSHHHGTGIGRKSRARRFSKTCVELPNSLLFTEGAQLRRDLSHNTNFPRAGDATYPQAVVDPIILTDPPGMNNFPSFGARGLSSLSCLSSEAVSINERGLGESIALSGAAYFPSGTRSLLSHFIGSAGHGKFGSDTCLLKSASPPLTPVSFTGTPIYRYGNDTSFVEDGFYTPAHQKSEEEITHSTMNLLNCLEPQESCTNTHISSPRSIQQVYQSSLYDNVPETRQSINRGSISSHGSEVKQLGVKAELPNRRKTRTKHNKSLDKEHHGQAGQRKVLLSKETPKPLLGLGEGPCSIAGLGQSGNPRSGRQNLSSEQRRANHIGSEKQRRDSIQGLEEELRRVVPVLRISDFSKAEMLEQAGNWLDSLIQGNGMLEAQLETKKM